MQRIDSVKSELQQLAKKWKWKESNLKLAGIGTPQLIVRNILLNGSYEPFVPLGSIRRNKIKEFSELLIEVDNDMTLFDEEKQQVLELAGLDIFIIYYLIISYTNFVYQTTVNTCKF